MGDANVDKAKGRIKQAAGDLTDDDDLKREGKTDELSGKAKDAFDTVKDKAEEGIDAIRDKVDDN